MSKTNEEKKALVKAIVAEFRDHNGGFVDDENDVYITDEGEEVYNPNIDHVTAEAWLEERLTEALEVTES